MSFKHKHKSSHCPEELSYSVFADTPGGMQRQESASLIASPTQSSSTTIMRKVSNKAMDDRGSIEYGLCSASPNLARDLDTCEKPMQSGTDADTNPAGSTCTQRLAHQELQVRSTTHQYQYWL